MGFRAGCQFTEVDKKNALVCTSICTGINCNDDQTITNDSVRKCISCKSNDRNSDCLSGIGASVECSTSCETKLQYAEINQEIELNYIKSRVANDYFKGK